MWTNVPEDDILLLFAYNGCVTRGDIFGATPCLVGEVQEMQLHRHLSRGRSANRARQTACQSRPHSIWCSSAVPAAGTFRYCLTEVFKGQTSPSHTCSEHRSGEASNTNREERRSNAVILIAASLIAAVRLNREEIRPSPSVTAKIADSIRLAEMIQARLRH
jgi:hypothetical protein